MKLSLRYAIVVFILILSVSDQYSQVTVSGVVTEEESGELIHAARISVSGSKQGVFSNEYGLFSIQLDKVPAEICISWIDYEQYCLFVEKDTSLSVNLAASIYQADSIIISRNSFEGNRFRQAGNIVVPIKQLKQVPALVGEADALKGLQLLPGIQFGVEATTGLYVRGGTPDQNLILLDEMPVYNVSHLLGFFSLFPPDVLQSAEVYRGGFPAKYGGRLSSVIRLQTKDGNLKTWKKKLSLGVLSSNIAVEGPLIKNKTSLFVSARRSWLDAFMRPISRASLKNQGLKGSFGYYFYDGIAKLTHRISDKERLYLSFYSGRDDNGIQIQDTQSEQARDSQGKLFWGNLMSSLRFNKVFSPNLFSNSTIGYSQYRYRSWLENSGSENQELLFRSRLEQSSAIKDFLIKQSLDYHPAKEHSWQIGVELSRKQFNPDVQITQSQFGASLIDTSFNDQTFRQLILSGFMEYKWSPSPNMLLQSGLRMDRYQLGDYAGWSFQPRISFRWDLRDDLSLKAAYSQVQQYIHLLSSTGVGLPADLWVPATERTSPPESSQSVLGLTWAASAGLELSLEAYYKDLKRVIEYKEGTSYFGNFANWEDRITAGLGKSYGVELFIHKPVGRLNGWLSYTLSKSTRQYEEINEGEVFPFRFDRRHNISLNLSYALKKPANRISASWMFVSGAKFTAPLLRYNTPFDVQGFLRGSGQNPITLETTSSFGNSAFYAEERNNLSMRPFHKLDISYANRKEKGKRARTWTFGVYNLYGTRNPLYVFFRTINDPSVPQSYGALQEYSFLLFIPSVSYSLEF